MPISSNQRIFSGDVWLDNNEKHYLPYGTNRSGLLIICSEQTGQVHIYAVCYSLMSGNWIQELTTLWQNNEFTISRESDGANRVVSFTNTSGERREFMYRWISGWV